MTYNTLETGAQSGKPVELYEFARGSTYYRYTSADVDIVHETQTFQAYPLQRSTIEATSEAARLALKIDCQRDLPMLDIFRLAPPSDIITLTLYRLHRGDTEHIVVWMGRILNVSWSGAAAQIHCESVYSSIKRPGLRRMYQKQCPHVLYSASCGVSAAAEKVTRTVSSITGLDVTVSSLSGFADGYFAGGYIEWITGGFTERRSIRGHTGNVLTVNFQPYGLAGSVDIYPGCDHTLTTCNTKYSNSANYGGMPYIPTKNPFDGTPVF